MGNKIIEKRTIELLISYSIEIIQALIRLYECGKIGLSIFENNIQLKIQLLKDFRYQIDDSKVRKDVDELIKYCYKIMTH